MKVIGIMLQIMAYILFGLGIFGGLSLIIFTAGLGLGLMLLGATMIGSATVFGVGSALIALREIRIDMERMNTVHEDTKQMLIFYVEQATESNARSAAILDYLAQTVKVKATPDTRLQEQNLMSTTPHERIAPNFKGNNRQP